VIVFAGIDPGKLGGITFLSEEGVTCLPLPGPHALRDLLVEWRPRMLFLEKATTFPKDGRVGAFRYGHASGVIEGLLIALDIPHRLVIPSEWMREMHKGTSSANDTKGRSVEAVRRLFPHADLQCGPRSKKPHLGIVESILIAEYCRRQK